MVISGNMNSTTIELTKASSGATIVKSLPIIPVDETWPVGMIVVKKAADTEYEKFVDGDTGIVGVLDEETDANEGIAKICVFGPVKKELLKVGLAEDAPTDAHLYFLQQRHLYGA